MGIAYKLFRYREGKLFPLYVLSTKETVMHKWLPAEIGERTEDGKVKTRLGKLALRPGWHCADAPTCTHIGKKGKDGRLYQTADTVWCEVEYADSINYQPEANSYGVHPRTGKFDPRLAQLRTIPVNGFYRYKTSPKMIGTWIITGSLKIRKILSRIEVEEICKKHGVTPQPMWQEGV